MVDEESQKGRRAWWMRKVRREKGMVDEESQKGRRAWWMRKVRRGEGHGG